MQVRRRALAAHAVDHEAHMLHVLTNEQMQEVDRETIDTVCPGLELMERAGRNVAAFIRHTFEPEARKAVVFTGPGNNGGDGLVIARHLCEAGWRCSVHLLKSPDKFTADAAKNYQRFKKILEDNRDAREFDANRPDATLFPESLAGTEEAKQRKAEVTATFDAIPGDLTALAAVFAGRSDDVFVPVGLSGETGEDVQDAVDAFVSGDRTATRFYVTTSDDPYALRAFDGIRRTSLPMRDSTAARAAVPRLRHLGGGAA